MANLKGIAIVLIGFLALSGCGDDESSDPAPAADPFEGDDLELGSVVNDKGDGFWGEAVNCKDLPTYEVLNDPAIVVSLDGLTLHLFDKAGDYDKVFPIGVGAIEEGESLTPTSTQFAAQTFYTKTDEPPVDDGPTKSEARWGWNQRCRVWWKSAETGKQVPVFAGLPFIRLAGHPNSASYGIHGPIDQYYRADGGALRRGYVSHGCVRMASDGISEVWGRIQGKRAEVRIQKAYERRGDGSVVDYDPWLLSECQTDADCDFAGGLCKTNPYRGAGFCTQACTHGCPDRAGYPMSFCVPDEDGPAAGYCTFKAEASTNACRRLDGFVERDGVSRPDQSASADVCVPGSDGWMGDRCLGDDECDSGLCTPLDGGPSGLCTESCNRYCPDKDGGYAATFCVEAPASVPAEGGMCIALCSSDDECPPGTACVDVSRYGQPSVSKMACVPQ